MRRMMLVALLAAAPLLTVGSTSAEAFGWGRGYGYAPNYCPRPYYGYSYAPYYRPRFSYGSYFYRPRVWGFGYGRPWRGYGYRGWGYGYRGGWGGYGYRGGWGGYGYRGGWGGRRWGGWRRW